MGSPQGFRVKVTKLSGFLREAVMRDFNFCKRQKTLVAVMANFVHPHAWSQKWFQDAIPTLSDMLCKMLAHNKQAEQLPCHVSNVCQSAAQRLPVSRRHQGDFGCEERRAALKRMFWQRGYEIKPLTRTLASSKRQNM